MSRGSHTNLRLCQQSELTTELTVTVRGGCSQLQGIVKPRDCENVARWLIGDLLYCTHHAAEYLWSL